MATNRPLPRWGAAAMLFIASGTHVPLIARHLEEAPYVGVLFIALSVVCFVLAICLVAFDADAVWLLSGAVCLAALVAFLASRTVGLPGIGDDVGNWTEPLGFPALFSETVVVVLTGVVLARHHESHRWLRARDTRMGVVR
jgi:hypothetical protein